VHLECDPRLEPRGAGEPRRIEPEHDGPARLLLRRADLPTTPRVARPDSPVGIVEWRLPPAVAAAIHDAAVEAPPERPLEVVVSRRGLARAVDRLSANSPSDSLRRVIANRVDVALLRALGANTGASRDLASVDSLDHLLANNAFSSFEWPGLYPALVAARLFDINGRPDRALTAARRHVQYFPESAYLAASLVVEARAALQLGDTATARAARDALQAFESPSVSAFAPH